jgi:DNA-binding NarL/FixJ family response regulator
MRQPIRVLLVDDHEVVRRGTRDVLELSPDVRVVGEAQDGAEALALTKEVHPDVVLMDVTMPGMSGIEATRLIKRASPGTAVLALSAFDDDPYVFALLDAGAAGYLLKNVRGPELVAAVRAVREGESILHPAIAEKVHRRAASRRGDGEAIGGEALTPREVEVLRQASKGLSNKEIAARLTISTRTVQVHLANIFRKLDVGSRTEAVLRGLRAGIIDLSDARA